MKPHILPKSHLVLWIAVATGWLAQAVHAEPFIRAVAKVDSKTVFATNNFILPPPSGSGAGVLVAGAHVFFFPREAGLSCQQYPRLRGTSTVGDADSSSGE